MSKKMFGVAIGGAILLSLVGFIFMLGMSSQNKAINLEESMNESKSSINVQEKRRGDLIINLVDSVQSYDNHEKETLTLLAEARTSASEGKVEEAQLTIQAVTEAYPELKSAENYKTLMNELATTENLITEHRNNYNVQVRAYSRHIRKFPNSFILDIVGYDKLNVKYLEYETSEDAPTNLFNKDE